MKRLTTTLSICSKTHSFPSCIRYKQNYNNNNLIAVNENPHHHLTITTSAIPLTTTITTSKGATTTTSKYDVGLMGICKLHSSTPIFNNNNKKNESINNNTVKNNYSCWKCGVVLGGGENQLQKFSLQCSSCKALQRLNIHGTGTDNSSESTCPNYFEIFGEKVTYRINLSKLAVEMKILQKNLHPDLFSLKSKEEQELSEQLSSFVNKAYSTLLNPIERAMYILMLQGIDSVTMEKKMTSDIEFLSQVMELNERLEEINNIKQLADFRQENNQQLQTLTRELERSFDANNIDEAVLVVSKMKYFDNLQQKLKEVQTRLGVVD